MKFANLIRPVLFAALLVSPILSSAVEIRTLKGVSKNYQVVETINTHYGTVFIGSENGLPPYKFHNYTGKEIAKPGAEFDLINPPGASERLPLEELTEIVDTVRNQQMHLIKLKGDRLVFMDSIRGIFEYSDSVEARIREYYPQFNGQLIGIVDSISQRVTLKYDIGNSLFSYISIGLFPHGVSSGGRFTSGYSYDDFGRPYLLAEILPVGFEPHCQLNETTFVGATNYLSQRVISVYRGPFESQEELARDTVSDTSRYEVSCTFGNSERTVVITRPESANFNAATLLWSEESGLREHTAAESHTLGRNGAVTRTGSFEESYLFLDGTFVTLPDEMQFANQFLPSRLSSYFYAWNPENGNIFYAQEVAELVPSDESSTDEAQGDGGTGSLGLTFLLGLGLFGRYRRQ